MNVILNVSIYITCCYFIVFTDVLCCSLEYYVNNFVLF